MKIFLQTIDVELWCIVNEGSYKATIIEEDLGKFKPNIRNELSVFDRTNLSLNAKTMNIFYNASIKD